MRNLLKQVVSGSTLTAIEAEKAMQLICADDVSSVQVAALLAAMHTRGETQAELLGFVVYLRKQSTLISDHVSGLVLDTCGTGGDYANTFNISTAAALLIASLGVKVAKHGGRSVSGTCGSANVLQALGICAEERADSVKHTLAEVGFVFLHAPVFNVALQKISTLRQCLGIRTCFNIIGPLLNPLLVQHQIVGVYSKQLLQPMAELLLQLGVVEAMVVHSRDRLDELSIRAVTDVAHVKNGAISYYHVDPKSLGFNYTLDTNLKGGDGNTNARIIEQVFLNNEAAHRDVVILNAAAGLVVAGVVESFSNGVELARLNIENGLAHAYLANLKKFHADNFRHG